MQCSTDFHSHTSSSTRFEQLCWWWGTPLPTRGGYAEETLQLGIICGICQNAQLPNPDLVIWWWLYDVYRCCMSKYVQCTQSWLLTMPEGLWWSQKSLSLGDGWNTAAPVGAESIPIVAQIAKWMLNGKGRCRLRLMLLYHFNNSLGTG